MAFTLPDLPYSRDALEPNIDARTMEIHHGKHHAAYVANANKALEGTALAGVSDPWEICRRLREVPETVAQRRATTPAGTRTTRSSGR